MSLITGPSMKFRIPLCLLALLLFIAVGWKSGVAENATSDRDQSNEVPYTDEEMEVALKNARTFIAEVDKGGETWNDFAEIVKKMISRVQWNITLGAMKVACGPNLSRKNLRGACYDRLPDSPPGRYFVFDHDAEFSRLNVRERIVMMKEGDAWKVAGYFRTKRISLNDGSSGSP